MTAEVTFEAVTPAHPDAEALMAMLDAEVDTLYGNSVGETGALNPELKAAFNGVFLVARRSGVPVACGGVLLLDAMTCELRRIYARPEERGSGVARALMAELERAAAERGMSRVLLETGDRQTRAIGFYEAIGYTRIPLYGEHVGKWWAVCYEKRILPDGITFEPATPDVPEVASSSLRTRRSSSRSTHARRRAGAERPHTRAWPCCSSAATAGRLAAAPCGCGNRLQRN